MKAKLCSDSQRWTLWFTSNTRSRDRSVFSEQAESLRLPASWVSHSPEGLKVLSLWQAAQNKDPSVVLQGDYAASAALPIALLTPICSRIGHDGWMRCERNEKMKRALAAQTKRRENPKCQARPHPQRTRTKGEWFKDCFYRSACFLFLPSSFFLFFQHSSLQKLPDFKLQYNGRDKSSLHVATLIHCRNEKCASSLRAGC